VLLARDAVGYRNLVKLSSLAYLEGFYVKPRVDRELLAAHSEGIIVTSACLAGEVAGHLMDDRWDAAREAAEWYANVFRDRYYLEVQAHDSQGQAELNGRSSGWAPSSASPWSPPTTRTSSRRATTTRTTSCCASASART
jgi:DNA polymerase-3 subunit alpha